MQRAHSLPKRRGLAVAVQLALTFAAGMYAPRLRAQQIACPANGVAVTAAENNSNLCHITGALTVDSGGTLDNTGTLRTNLTVISNQFVGSGTLTNSGTLNNNGLGELTIDYQGTLDNNSGGILNNNGAGIPGTDRGLTVRGTLRNNSGGLLNNNGKLRLGGTTSVTYDLFRTRTGDFSGTIENTGTLTNSSIMDLYFASTLHNNSAGSVVNNSGAFLTLRNSARINNNSGGTVNNNGSLRFLNYSVLRNNSGAVFNNSGTLELSNVTELYSSGTLNNDGTLTIRDRSELTSSNLVNRGSLVNHSSGAFPNPTEGGLNNRGTMTNAGSLINYGKFVNIFGTFTNDWFLTNRGNLYNRRISTLHNDAYLDNYAGATFDNYGDLNNNLGARFGNSGTLLNYTDPGRAFTNHGRLYNHAGGLLTNRGVLNNTGLLYNSSGYMGPGGTIDNSGAIDNSGLIQNNGALTNSGTLTSGALTIDAYGGRSGGLVNQGTLTNTGTLTTEGLLNYGQLDNLGGGALTANGALFNHGALSNAGAVTITNTHALTNYGTFSNLAGGVIDNNGYLVNYATLTNAGTLNNNLAGIYSGLYNRGQLTSSGTFNNAGRVYNDTGATFTNSGTLNNTYVIANDHGGTISNTGTLNNNSGLLFNSSSAYLNNNGTFNNNGTLSNFGTLANSGTLVNNGTLFSNGAIVNSGAFIVASPVGGPLGTFTQSAGVLEGNGSLTQSVVTINGGVLRPGAAGAPGTLTINGSLALGAGAVLEINATPAQTSRVTVNGAASVAGMVELVAGAGTYPETRQTILSATGGVTGTFSGVTTASAFLTPSLSYDPNSVFLSFYQSAAFGSVAMTPNQMAVSTLLDTIQGGDAGLQAAIGTLSGLSAEQARAAYDSLAAAANTSAAFHLQFDLADGFMRTLTSRLGGAGSGGITAMLPVQVASAGARLDLSSAAARDGAWVLAYGNHGKTDGDVNAAGYRQDGAGVAFGADTEFGERWRAGAAVNIGTQRAKLDQDSGKVTADGVSIAAYARYTGGAFTLDGMAGVGRNGSQSTRTIAVGGPSQTASADYDSDQQFAHLELTIKGWRIEPIAGLGYIRVDSPAYTEAGAGALSLAVDGQARESIKSYLGARYVHELGGSLKLAARALWTHEFGDADSALATARFSGAPAAGAFQTTGVALKRDGALLGVGLSGDWKRNLSLFGDVSVEARQGQWNAGVFAGARYTW
jgi:fibronectin-binding autotransporter adhesin